MSSRCGVVLEVYQRLILSSKTVAQAPRQRRGRGAFTKANETAFAGGEEEAAKPIRNKGPRIGRIDPAPGAAGRNIRNAAARRVTAQSDWP